MSDFDRRWRPTGPDDRMLEYQARHARSVARLGRAYPEQPIWRDYARHGLRYINDVMRDGSHGGWFWLVSRDGVPMALETKHAHSTAYVIGAFVEIYNLTGDQEALDSAQQAFDWLDDVLHDDVHGGYHGWATRDGKVILRPDDIADWERAADPLGHGIGLKDLNIHSDLLDAVRLLHAARPSEKVRARAQELYDIVEQQFTAADASMHYLLRADLTPVEDVERPGYAFQSAYRMHLLAPTIGRDAEQSLALRHRVVERGLATGWSPDGGVYEYADGRRHGKREWWVQTETFQSLVLLEVATDANYRAKIDAMAKLIDDEMVDDRFGGWYQVPISEWSLIDRLRPRRWPKAHRWKDSSHETDMCLLAIRILRGLDPDAPLV
jgi:mannobiose 2-epimerase